MRIYYLLYLFCFGTLSCNSQSTPSEHETREKTVVEYGEPIRFMIAIHNEHPNPDSLRLEFIDNNDQAILIHQGIYDDWGMRWADQKVRTGEYLLRLEWFEEDGMKVTERKIFIKYETNFFSLNIELANEPEWRVHNGIYLDQYTNSLDDVLFTRKWDPKDQFLNDSLLLPDYDVENKNDSTLYGSYMRMSSMLSINWVQPHSIAFMHFEVFNDSIWSHLRCSAPRIKMNLKSGEKGETLKDMVLGCSPDKFDTNKTYRIVIDYLINDKVFEENPKQGNIEDNVYVEQTIHSYTDEFTVK